MNILRFTLAKLINFAKRLWIVTKVIPEIYRSGGYALHTIAVINYGQRLQGKRVLVTGGGGGIGLSIAKKCIAEGAIVVITGRSIERLKIAASEIQSGNLRILEWDISLVRELKEKIDQANRLLGGEIDILINNAGVLSTVQFPDVSEEIWDNIYSVNSRGMFFLTQAICGRWMRERKGGRIINISSQGGLVGATYPYRMTKWDIVGLTQGLGIKLAPYGIIVNGIAPGIVATEMQPQYMNQKNNVFCSLNPVKRYAFPAEIAELALFLMSDAANFIVGQTIVCDGGFSIK